MSPRSLSLIAAAALLALAAGCMPTWQKVQNGIEAYRRGDYPQAMQRFVETEGDQGSMPAEGQCLYLVYRGLAAFKLGNKAEAKVLLAKGKRAYDAGDPRWLSIPIATEMDKALAELGGP